MGLAKAYTHLRFVVQDRPGTAREGEAVRICGLMLNLATTIYVLTLLPALEEDPTELHRKRSC